MAKIYIDNREYEVEAGKNLLEVALSLGLNLPYFCWHPKLGSVGACRQCAVTSHANKDDEKGRIVMACMQPVHDNMVFSVESEEARQFRKQVIESLMTNHPHDCPTCDEGGECHLQDMTVMTGHSYRRFRFDKRTHRNQYLGPLINHEMNRCISCYRCVRFYKDYAGGKDLDVFAAHHHVYFGRHSDGVLESEFSGNLAEICPTGVFTDLTLKKHYTRKWDFSSAPSVCNLCSLGCNTIAGERYNQIRRIKTRYNPDVNGYFICDRGRFGYEYMNSPERIRVPFINNKKEKSLKEYGTTEILSTLKKILKENQNITGIGSPRASLESNYALKKLVGEENFYSGMSPKEHELVALASDILLNNPAKVYSMKEVEKADCVLILGEDLTNTAPMLALAVRQSVRQQGLQKLEERKIYHWDDKTARESLQNEKGPFYSITPVPTKLDELSSEKIYLSPYEIGLFGNAIAHFIDSDIPIPAALSKDQSKLAEKISSQMSSARNIAIISGTSCLNSDILKAASNIAVALNKKSKPSGLCFVFQEANSLGLSLLGGRNISELFTEKGKYDSLIILENDLFRRVSVETATLLSERYKNLIVIDSLANKTTAVADIVLPAAVITESDGHLVNNEGRVQRYFRVFNQEYNIQSGWKWLQALAEITGKSEMAVMGLVEDYSSAIASEYDVFKGMEKLSVKSEMISNQKIPRKPHRYSGRTAMYANRSLTEPRPPEDLDSPLVFTMEGFQEYRPSPYNPFYWSPGWNSIQALNKYQIEVGGELINSLPGLCLFDKKENTRGEHKYFELSSGQNLHKWRLIPIYHIYGSEELSIKNGNLRELMQKSYVAVNKKTAVENNWEENTELALVAGERTISLPLRFLSTLPYDAIGLPIGLEGMPFIDFETEIKITKK